MHKSKPGSDDPSSVCEEAPRAILSVSPQMPAVHWPTSRQANHRIGTVHAGVRWIGLALVAMICTASKAADAPSPTLSDGVVFSERSGSELYQGICQGCHMSNAQGASGAGAYPALRHNVRLASASYPVYNVLHGRNGMPGFAKLLTDAQVADVVNYVRTHFDNHYPDAVAPSDVAKLR